MTLQQMDHIEQGTPEWHDQRRGIVTASVVGQLLTPTLKPARNDTSRALTALLVAERITGWTEDVYVSADMWRGREDEPRAVALYSTCYAPVTTTGFMVRDVSGFKLGYSPDGLVGEHGLIEVKSRKPKKHLQTILSGTVPPENMAQLQAGLLVSGRAWIDYVSYCGGMPMWVTRVPPDAAWRQGIREALELFEGNAAQMLRAYTYEVEGFPPTERVIEQDIY